MPEQARRLNKKGLDAFELHIRELASGAKLDTPANMLTDPRYSEAIDIDCKVERRSFENRFELGQFLAGVLKETPRQAVMGDVGFWSWLALYWFDDLCPAQKNGTRKPSKPYNYVLSRDYNHRPRHAVYTTWMLVDQYGETALFLLSKQLHERGELIEQLAARQYLISCHGVIEAAKDLYYDPKRQTFKRGATSRRRQGSIRRYVSYLQQLDLTYDLGTIASSALLGMLPDEYTAFRAANSS